MFRLLNVDGRAALEREGSWFDLGRLSGDEALADPMAAVARSGELHALTERCDPADAEGPLAGTTLGAPVPEPRQVFGIGLNYRDHAGESGTALPPAPLTFTKFPSCIVGPTSSVPLSGQSVDWEAEIVAVIGTECRSVPLDEAWGAVAGLMLGQDISDREVQQRRGRHPSSVSGRASPATDPPARRWSPSTPSRTPTTSPSGATSPVSGCRSHGHGT